MSVWKEFPGPNAGYVLDLYDRYSRDPSSVDEATRALFEHWCPTMDPAAAGPATDAGWAVGAANLAQAVRKHGHLAARLDPLGREPPGDPALQLAFHSVTEKALRQLPASLVGGPLAEGAQNAFAAIEALRKVYCATTGYDFAHIREPEERLWLRDAVERRRFRPPSDPFDPKSLLKRLTRVEVFERFLHRVFPGRTRFSIEGLDILVPVLDEVIAEGAEAEIHNILLGMAHRGRLNVLAHILQKPYAEIFGGFLGTYRAKRFRDDLGWTGDVKYHMGAHRAVHSGEVVGLVISMPPNPSHLELVNPVLEGMARAAGTQTREPGSATFDPDHTLPVLVHGDAAFPGQGVVAETLNLSRLPGYWTGGTIHVIANNQLGYTTLPRNGRSTRYASDLAKGFSVPILHVNADDPEACIEAARLAFAYRRRFEKDFVIDLVGYRRYGHNEGDEPSFTQPLLYDEIAHHPTVREVWARSLAEAGVVSANEADDLVAEVTHELQKVYESLNRQGTETGPEVSAPQGERPRPREAAATAVPVKRLQKTNRALHALPEGFTLHRKMQRFREQRLHSLDDPAARSVDWAVAEELALATILQDGIAVRLTGEDVERGTFSQRHAVLHDAKSGNRHIPLQALPKGKAAFEIFNSPLSENACVGFEYGYSVQAPGRLVIWEAQYGDFINGAQPVLDEFLLSGDAKWRLKSSLVLLLPHAYEGQGPDHSSGRLERFLSLAADGNQRVCNPTSAAQYFHLLRLQAALLEVRPVPLVILTPKSLLRDAFTASSPADLAQGGFAPVLDDPEAKSRAGATTRLLLCTGKIASDLFKSERRKEHPEAAVVRLEQIYPFPANELADVASAYPNLKEAVWVQEEPQNMGAWPYVREPLQKNLGVALRYVGRTPQAAPAEGSAAWHASNQEAIVQRAYEATAGAPDLEMVTARES